MLLLPEMASFAAANQSTFLCFSFSSFSVFDYVLKHSTAPIKKEMLSPKGVQSCTGMLRREGETTEKENKVVLLYLEIPLALHLSFRG